MTKLTWSVILAACALALAPTSSASLVGCSGTWAGGEEHYCDFAYNGVAINLWAAAEKIGGWAKVEVVVYTASGALVFGCGKETAHLATDACQVVLESFPAGTPLVCRVSGTGGSFACESSSAVQAAS